MMEEDWKNSFKDKLGEYEFPGGESSYEAVEEAVRKSVRARRSVRLFAAAVGVAAAAAGIFALVGEFRHVPSESVEIVSESPAAVSSSSSVLLSDAAESAISEKNQISAQSEPSVSSHKRAARALPETPVYEIGSSAEDGSENAGEEKYEENDDEKYEKKSESPTEIIEPSAATLSFTDNADFQDDVPLRKPGVRKRVSAKVYGGGLSSVNSTSASSASVTFAAADVVMGEGGYKNSLPVDENVIADDVMEREENHYRPLRFGVSVSVPLSKRFSVESGLEYSFLHSRFSSSSVTGQDSETDQYLHFIGIPLKMSASLYSTGRFNFYVSAGGMAEKLVKGRIHTDREPSESVSMNRLQWSLSGNAGAEYNFTPHLGLYFEPGVSWYLDNGSSLRSSYSDRPVFFDASLGLRFTL